MGETTMGVLDLGWKPKDPKEIAQHQVDQGLFLTIDGQQHEVVDGDTTRGADGQLYRIEGLTAPEVTKADWTKGVGEKVGEQGGQEASYNLWKVLTDGKFDTFTSSYDQEYGGGAGKRKVVNVGNAKGQNAKDVIYEAGLADITDQTDQAGVNAKRDGELERSLFGTGSETEQQFGALRDNKPNIPLVFKGLALNEQYFDPDYYSGVEFRDNNVELYDEKKGRGGFTKSPINTAWNAGWINTQADIGGALDALGVAVGSEWLQGVGQEQRIKAGTKLAEVPALKVQQLQDIAGDGFVDTLGNVVEWVGVNTTMSLPYMAAIAAPTILAAPFTGGASLAAGAATRAVAGLPAMALHTGNVWNQVDVDNRSREAAAKAMTAGLGMTLLDTFALGRLLAPSQVLTKEGKDIAIKHIAKTRTGGDEVAAKILFNQTAKNETVKFLDHMGSASVEHIKKANLLKDTLAAFARSAPIEAVTEAGQEITGYLTAAHINGEEPDLDELQNIALNAAAAGGVVGGVFGSAGNIVSASKLYNIRKGLEDFDPSTLNEYQQVYWELEQEGNPDGTIEDQIRATKDAKSSYHNPDDKGFFYAAGEESKQDPYWKDKLQDEEGRWSANPINIIDTALHYTGRLVKAPLLNWINPDDLRKNPFIRSVVGRTMNNRGIGAPGKHFEARRDYIGGTLNKVFDDRRVLKEFGIGTSNESAAVFTRQFREFGRSGLFDRMVAAKKAGTLIPEADLDAVGLSREQADTLYETAKRANNMMKASRQTERDALVMEFGKGSKVVKDFDSANIDGYWWKRQSLDAGKVMANEPQFTKFMERMKQRALNNPNLSASKKDQVRQTNIHDLVTDIIYGGNTDLEGFSLVEGSDWAGKGEARLFDLSSDNEFKDFASDNIFDTYSNHNAEVAKRTAHLEYFGDGGSDLDYLYRQALDYEINTRGVPEDEARKKIGRLAKAHRDVIDASSKNYNRIVNRRLAALQKNFMTYATITYLPLAALSSIPEFGTVALDLSNSKEARAAISTSLKEIKKGLSKTLLSVEQGKVHAGQWTGSVAGLAGIKGQGVVEVEQAQDLLEGLGIDETPAALFQKLGMEDALPSGEKWKKLIDRFFTFTGVRGVTQVQRRINASFASDFAFNRLMEIINVPEGSPYNQNQGIAYEQLRSLGMDVPRMLSAMRDEKVGLSKDILDLTLTPEQRAGLAARNESIFQNEMETFIGNFVNERVQNPGAANRPLIFQDPHFASIFMFNGFLSTFTANVVPKLWNDKVGKAIRKKNPTLAYNAFALIATMTALGALGQWMRDYLKYGGSSPYLKGNQIYHRAFLASGTLGQFEKIADVAYPLYPTRGEGPSGRLAGQAFGVPGRIASTTQKGFETLSNPNAPDGAALNNFLKLAPVFAMFPWARNAVNPRNGDTY